ncbi:MAG: sugar phosphate isomerase/epimerase [Tannerella sp.]|jgi:sugar phosphate isomerase/epimerase|nr:sugar phosphate isomerase/epimerase [Tannerella sp.]
MKIFGQTMWTIVSVVITACSLHFSAKAADKPDSKFGGVQIGAITYSYRSLPDQSLTATLDYAVRSGLSSVELMGGPVEQYAGIPGDKDAVRQWRTTVSMDKFKDIKKLFKDKGVKIDILKLGDPGWSDEEIDYAFNVCKTLGARGISTEISVESAGRLLPFAEKHKLYVIFHNHGQPGDPNFSFEKVLSLGGWLMLNFDAGHYFGATGQNPCDLIRRLHNRIASIHLKDKTGPKATPADTNRPWGEGETPIAEILQLIRKEKMPITCDIELEYDIPAGSDAVGEVRKCVEYCRAILAPEK